MALVQKFPHEGAACGGELLNRYRGPKLGRTPSELSVPGVRRARRDGLDEKIGNGGPALAQEHQELPCAMGLIEAQDVDVVGSVLHLEIAVTSAPPPVDDIRD